MRASRVLVAALIVASACSDKDGAADTAPAAPIDADGDDVEAALDCDDGDADVHPGAEETCDGTDQDCDEAVDEAAVDVGTWYADADADGYGGGETLDACELPSGYAASSGDCDDGDADIYPDAPERCDDVDQDCDGVVDEEPADPPTWYVDADNDGYGDPNADPVAACDQPEGHLAEGAPITDCDDAQPDVHPGVFDLCGDGVDANCDGVLNSECVYPLWDVDATRVGEFAEDDAASALAGAGDVDGDGFDDLIVGAPEFKIDGAWTGVAYVIYGPISGADSLEHADAKLIGVQGSSATGGAVAGAGDVDGDGYDDLLVGAEDASNPADQLTGVVYLVRGGPDGSISGEVSLADATAEIIGAGTAWWDDGPSDLNAGCAVAGAGDVNGDGLADLIIGASDSDRGGEEKGGAAYLVLSPVTGEVPLSDADAAIMGDNRFEYAGASVAGAGDVNGDGLADLIIGTPSDPALERPGEAWLVLGPVSSVFYGSSSDAGFIAESNFDAAGTSVDGAGDVDGDGYDDLLIGAPGHNAGWTDSGAAYLIAGPVSGLHHLSTATARLLGEQTEARAGAAVSGAGDVDGDGLADVLVGAPDMDTRNADAGRAYLALGPISGTLGLSEATAQFTGGEAEDYAGRALDGAGDVDGDGLGDLLIGAAAPSERGTAYLLYGGSL